MHEHKIVRVIRRINDFWRATRFLAQGGRFKVLLDWGADEPRLDKGYTLLIGDNCTVDLSNCRTNALAGAYNRMAAKTGLIPAKPGDPDAFLVKYAECRKDKLRREFSFGNEPIRRD